MGVYLQDVLHLVSQSMLYPTIAVVLLLITFIIFSIGSIIVEAFTERRHFRLIMPDFLNELDKASPEDISTVIETSALLKNQKRALLTLFKNGSLPEESRFALAKRLISKEEERYHRIISRTDYAAKAGPMLGLMGTLIPLGPGIVALGQGDTATLSSSLLVAFDTTTAGLACSLVSLVISMIRKRWYNDYMVALKACMSTALEKIEIMSEEGDFVEEKPSAEYKASATYKRTVSANSEASSAPPENKKNVSRDNPPVPPEGFRNITEVLDVAAS